MRKRSLTALLSILGMMTVGISCQTQSLSQRTASTRENAEKSAAILRFAPVREQDK
ncbi:MAG: hypothetical protein KDN22_34030 [Verrucomicrobiae bacterium]|nr:hypothetical protein [Verrucomicrobiae bacterium]